MALAGMAIPRERKMKEARERILVQPARGGKPSEAVTPEAFPWAFTQFQDENALRRRGNPGDGLSSKYKVMVYKTVDGYSTFRLERSDRRMLVPEES